MKKLVQVLQDFENQTPHYLAQDNSISGGNVGWHIIHSCLVITSVAKSILQSDPSTFKKTFSWKAFIVLLLAKFPRGKVKAPSFTQPASEITSNTVLEHIKEARKSAALLLTANKKLYFTHPIFGDLQLPSAIRFLYVHSYHHEKIIRDILRKNH